MRNIASEMVDEVSALSEKYPHEFQIDPFDLSTWRILVAAATQNLEYQLTDGWSFIAPTSIRSTTDADGRFRLKIPFGGKFYVFAIIRRGSGVNQLEFAWAVSSDSFSLDEDLVLSNRNLCSTGRAPLKNAIADAGQEHPAPPKPESTKIATRLGAMILVTKPMGGTYKIFAGNADSGILVREGETPASVDKIEPGKYTIRFSLPGYMDETKEVVVGPNGDTVDVVSVIMRPL